MARLFNPPPGWPKPEEGWTPPPGWKPDPSWPEPPKGWDFWTEKADEFGSSLFSSTAASASSLFGDAGTGADSYGTVSTPQEGEQGGTEYGAPHAPTYTSPSGSTTSEPGSPSGGGASSNSPSYGGASGSGAPGGQAPSYGGASGPSAQTGPTQPPHYGGSSGTGVQPGPTSTQGTQGGPTAPPGAPTAPPDATPRRAGTTLGLGVVMLLIGVGITGYSYMNPDADGTFRLVWVPMLIGVILIIQGLVQMARRRAANAAQRYTGGGYGGAGQHGTGESGLGHNSTVPTQNPTDPNFYKRGR